MSLHKPLKVRDTRESLNFLINRDNSHNHPGHEQRMRMYEHRERMYKKAKKEKK